jgi:hypothetical protein
MFLVLDEASYPALWALTDRGGPRPEYLLPVLYFESGFNPAAPNAAGYPYYGLNQISGDQLARQGIDVGDYLTWPASRQLTEVVTPYMLAQIAYGGALNSGARTYQAEFLPATLHTARSLTSVLTTRGQPAYDANTVFDWDHTGTITVGDLAHAVATMAAKPAVQSAIAEAYAIRPGESPKSSVYGTDFPWYSRLSTFETVLVVGVAASALLAGTIAVRNGHIRL